VDAQCQVASNPDLFGSAPRISVAAQINAAISGVVECFKISKAAAKIGLASSCRHATALIPVFLNYRY